MFLNPRGMGTKKPPWGGWRVVLGLWFRLCSCQSVEFGGTGYDAMTRVLGDFGSRIYIFKKIN